MLSGTWYCQEHRLFPLQVNKTQFFLLVFKFTFCFVFVNKYSNLIASLSSQPRKTALDCNCATALALIPLCGAKIWFLQGATHAQLIQGAQEASDGKVTGRFFHLHPRRLLRLVPWLAGWIRKGAVPVATMNMQVAVPEGEEVPDAWHHQLIFGVAQNAIFMTNPLDVGKRRGVKKIP